jgi:predicted nuclease of predicted toxin-antitoxin system
VAAFGRPRRDASARRRAAPPPRRDIFQKGFIEHRVVLTFDLDFGEIVAASESRVVSVVLFRLHNTRTGHVIERLQAVLEQSSTELRS